MWKSKGTMNGNYQIFPKMSRFQETIIEAAEKVHTDFAKHFIKAEVILVGDLLSVGGWKNAKEEGKIRLEGRDYIVKDGDVIEFKIG